MYGGYSRNKFQNNIILSIFKIVKIWDIRFVGKLILNTSFEFHYDDVTVKSVINIIPQGTTFCYSFFVARS